VPYALKAKCGHDIVVDAVLSEGYGEELFKLVQVERNRIAAARN
jgi:hypothetical protein